MLKLSELHARHQHLTLSLVLRGFKTPGTRLWFILPPQVMKTLPWHTGQRWRCKVANTAWILTPLRQASAVRRVPPRKRTAPDQRRQDLAWQACLKGLKRSATTKRLVMRQQPGPVTVSVSRSKLKPQRREPVAESMPVATGHSPLPTEPAQAEEPVASTSVCGVVHLAKFRWLVKHLEIVLLMLLLLLIVLGVFVPMSLYAYRHVFGKDPIPKPALVQSAGRMVSVSPSGGCFTRALVETDSGYYALLDGISLKKTEALTLETRADKARFLCDRQHRCVKLIPDDPVQ